MAFLAQLTAQAEELVAAVTSLTPDKNHAVSATLRDATLKSLRHHKNLRTNQFEVDSCLTGLVERFSVAGRDELAEALRARRTALAHGRDENGELLTTRWTPDILQFLLELSDRPTGQPNLLDDLNELIASRQVHEPPPLRWEDISREDGWGSDMVDKDDDDEPDEDDSYWYDDDDGGDDDGGDGGKDDGTTVSSVDSGGNLAQMYRVLVTTDGHTRNELTALLTAVRDSQKWRTAARPTGPSESLEEGSPVLVSELHIVRDSLFMLQGLETTLFGSDCIPVDHFQLSDVTSEMHASLMGAIAAIGQKLLPLRRRAVGHSISQVPLLQVFQEAIRQRLHTFDQEVTQIQTRFIKDSSQEGTVVSIAAILYELQPSLRNLFALANVVENLGVAERSHAHAFRYLEVLFDATSVAQFEGDNGLYTYLGTLFFECFQVYLRPIRAWMEDGVLDTNDKIFFVTGAATTGSGGATVPLHQIWHSQYKLLRTSTGALHAPRFLQPAASKIFTTGKSIVVLQQLGKYDKQRRRSNEAEPTLDFQTVCPPDMALVPFAQLFGDAFEGWIQSKHHAASATLQTTLLDACGLWASLEALHRVFLMADGAAVDAFVSRVFHSLDSRNARWLDRYTMTEMAREDFAEALGEDASRLSVTVDNRGLHPDSDNPAVARRSVRDGVARIRLTYRLAWPVQIIIPADTITRGYQAMFTFLLQIRRASAVLSRHRLLNDTKEDMSSSSPLFFSLRSRLLWFCNALQSYLATLVIAPRIEALRASLQGRKGADVDAMIAIHDQFVRALVDEALLGTTLKPLHSAVLELLDLALRLEEAHRQHAARMTSALQETWRLSVLSVPTAASPRTPRQAAKQRVLGASESVRKTLFLASPGRGQAGAKQQDDERLRGDVQEDAENDDENDEQKDEVETPYKPYKEALRVIRDDLDSTLRFLAGGLRGVARASRNATAAAKWDMLAEMLGDDGSGRTARSRWA
ncbi:hypothetical protein SEPCBS57363_005963 [Sporothrix epigloea]|uniref:Spindle pole body component n=1 Tax=Sporothrix epigloea TaxID=1892477 RepID=A0ABP0E4I3_9PEZI